MHLCTTQTSWHSHAMTSPWAHFSSATFSNHILKPTRFRSNSTQISSPVKPTRCYSDDNSLVFCHTVSYLQSSIAYLRRVDTLSYDLRYATARKWHGCGERKETKARRPKESSTPKEEEEQEHSHDRSRPRQHSSTGRGKGNRHAGQVNNSPLNRTRTITISRHRHRRHKTHPAQRGLPSVLSVTPTGLSR